MTAAQIAQQLELLRGIALPAEPAWLAAMMTALGYEEADRDTYAIEYASALMPGVAAVASLRDKGRQLVDIAFYLADHAAEGDAEALRATAADTLSALRKQLGGPLPEYPRGKRKHEIHGQEDRYVWHRLPNGLDIIVPHGVDPTQPIEDSKKSRWVLADGKELLLYVTPRAVELYLQPSALPSYEDGLAVTWDGQDTAPEPSPQSTSVPPTQLELLTALAAAPWPANLEALRDLLTRMDYEHQMELFGRESWSKYEYQNEDDFVGTLRQMVIRTYPETGKQELSVNVVLDEVLAEKRKGPPFKGMEQAFDQALAHARTVLGPPIHEAQSQETGTSDAPSALRLAQWRQDEATVSLVLEHSGPAQALGVNWRIEPDAGLAK